MKICAFTGHRPQKFQFGFDEADERCVRLQQVIREHIIQLIEKEGVSYFISGMAMGVDMYAAEIVLDLKGTSKNSLNPYHITPISAIIDL